MDSFLARTYEQIPMKIWQKKAPKEERERETKKVEHAESNEIMWIHEISQSK